MRPQQINTRKVESLASFAITINGFSKTCGVHVQRWKTLILPYTLVVTDKYS